MEKIGSYLGYRPLYIRYIGLSCLTTNGSLSREKDACAYYKGKHKNAILALEHI
jgi:hypothetical protein